MSNNSNLHKAKKAKNDEFYTMYEDIKKELIHYKEHFKGKVVYTNCDDPRMSNFFKYFYDNFDELGLKKLISTHFNINNEEVVYKYEVNNLSDGVVKTALKGDGDFASDECIELLKEADIVVSNPPFSLFRKYIDVIIDSKKDFIILGSNMSTTYTNVFNYIKEGIILGGYNIDKSVCFHKPYGGIKAVAITWITSFDLKIKRIELNAEYNDHNYEKVDNYKDCIFCKNMKEVPKDYNGYIAIPITGLLKYDLSAYDLLCLLCPVVNEENKFRRIIIKRK